MVGLYGVVPCWKDGRRGQGAFRTVWAGCCGAGRVCKFPQRAGCRRSGNPPLESASVAAGRAGLPRAACRTGPLTRDRAAMGPAKARRPTPRLGLHARVKDLWSGRTAGHSIGRPAASGLSANALSTARPAGAVDWRNHSLAIADPSPARRLSRL